MNKQKIALISICLNEPYWQYIGPMIESAKKFFLPGHEIDFICWSDMPPNVAPAAKIIPTTPTEWPLPTLFRYHLFLNEEELLKEFDYIFYVDADMLYVSKITADEVLGDRVAAHHPMYALRPQYNHPWEANPKSTAYIPAVGYYLENPKRFVPLYAAGGFQGGRSELFIEDMKIMKARIDTDFKNGYISRWNDESHWNRLLLDRPATKVLSPSFIMPDSLNRAYYQKLWGRNYVPKLVTITKAFSLSKDGGAGLNQTLKNL